MPENNIQTKRYLIFAFLYAGYCNFVIANDDASNGFKVYTLNCIVCHGDDGAGQMPGVPDLIESNKWTKKTDEQLLETIKKGTQGSGSTISMPPNGGNPDLSDTDIRDAIIYMRKTFSN